jgi:tetratricopeptide (TPR) repeat protein
VFNQFAAVATAPGAIANNYHFNYPPVLPTPFSPQSRVGALPIKNTSFTGRVDELAEIERSLSRAQQGIITQSVVGLGGVGKTQLVTEYVYQSIEMKRYGHIVWLDARHPLEAYKNLGKTFHIQFESNDSEAQCINKVERLLQSRNASLLLVWDDAKDQAQMQPYLASAARLNAHCLITSRAQYFGGARTNLAVIRLDVFNEVETLDYMQKRFIPYPGLFEEASTKALAKILHYLPLALSQAVAYIVNRREQDGVYNYAISDYIKEYQKASTRKLRKFCETSSDDEYQETVWTTWYLSINALSSAGKKQAIDLLEHCAYCDGNAIADEFLSLVINIPTEEITDSIRALLSYSLVERIQGNPHPSIKIHQLLQDVIRLHLQEESLPTSILLSLPALEGAAQDKGPVPEALIMRRYLTDKTSQWQWDQREMTFHFPPSNPPISPEELEAARAQKESPAAALCKLVIPGSHSKRHHQMIALLLKQLEKAFHYDEQPIEQLRAAHGLFASHIRAVCHHAMTAEIGAPDAAHLLSHLGGLTHHLKDAKEKQDIYLKILPYYRDVYCNHPLLGKVLGNLATAYGDLGNYKEQEFLLKEALVIFIQHYGDEHVDVACALNSLSNVYGALGDPKEQKNLAQCALEIFEGNYGPDHVEVARTLNNLANAYGSLGDQQEKKSLLQRTLLIQKRHYGAEHVEVANILNNLATAYGELDDRQEKKALLERALRIQEKHYGLGHVDVAITLNNLANVYGDLDDHQEKKHLLLRALEIQENYYDSEHVEIARTLVNLGDAYCALGELELAQSNYHRALRIRQPFFGEAHPEVGRVLFGLAILYYKQKKFSLRFSYLEQIYAIYFHHPNCGPTHPDTLRALEQLNQLAPHMSKLEAMAQQYTHSQHMGDQAFENKDYPAAILHWLIALPFVTAQSFLSSTKKLDAILLYERLGEAYREQGELDKALANFAQAQTQLTYLTMQQSDDYLRIASKKSVCDIKLAANLAHQRGVVHYKAGNWAQAIIAFQEGLKKNQVFFEKRSHADVAMSYWCLSSCYLQQTDYTQALVHVEQAYTQRQALLGETAELTRKAKERLTFCKEALAHSATTLLNSQELTMPIPLVSRSVSEKITACYQLSLTEDKKFQPMSFFKNMGEHALTWPELISHIVFENHFEELPSEHFEALILYRDTLDFKMYQKAMEEIFSDDKFTIKAEGVNTGEFSIKIYASPAGSLISADNFICKIIFNAPGTRSQTSDVDTTILPQIEFLVDHRIAGGNLLGKGSDYTARLWASIIHHFDRLNQKQFGLVTALHRDTNPYAAGFLNVMTDTVNEMVDIPKEIRGVYPQFRVFKQMLDKFELWDDKELEAHIEEQRKQKHCLEMAASLLPLKIFHHESSDEWGALITKLQESHPADFEIILKYINTFDAFIREASAGIKHSPSLNDANTAHFGQALQDKNLKIAAYNRKYVEGLTALAEINHRVYQHYFQLYCNQHVLKEGTEQESLATKFAKARAQVPIKQRGLADQQSTQPVDKHEIEEAKEALSRAEQAVERLRGGAKKVIKSLVTDMVVKQKTQIMANLFAIEAYFNYAAPYHVVRGIQQKQLIQITHHVIMGSVLQQIGFYLLHRKESEEEGHQPGRVLYKTAKYGARILDIIRRLNNASKMSELLSQIPSDTKQFLEVLEKAERDRKSSKAMSEKLTDLQTLYTQNMSLFNQATGLLQDLVRQVLEIGYESKIKTSKHSWGKGATLFAKWQGTLQQERQSAPNPAEAPPEDRALKYPGVPSNPK